VADRRVLIIEDESDVAETTALVLRGAGYAVDVAENAARAQARLNATQYSMVIADWRLPDGDGLELANIAAATGSKTILMSAYLFQIPAAQTAKHELLMKPVRASELVAIVKRLMD
jgi:DNA-binding response OmpR family regulator